MSNQSYQSNDIILPVKSFIPFVLEQLASCFACITNMFSIIIIISIKYKTQLFKYILVISLTSFAYSILWTITDLLELFLPDCYTKFVILIIMNEYFITCLAMMIVFIDVYISLQRLLILMNKTWLDKVSFTKSIIFFLALMLLYYLPIFAEFKIAPVDNSTYTLESTEYARSDLGITIRLILTSFRVMCLIIVLPFINICSSLVLKRHLNKKMKIKLKPSKILKKK